ncbi:hypothetical protein [Spongiibacter tropicus]|uniref:hypothetical protein n=1 Tax=Spongiibacter tropicus TaxID=454602 RepID=UPI0024E1B83A|nr:hypothetical protein [Spongiibacter tropicus]
MGKEVSLTFRGFEKSPSEVVNLIGVEPSYIGTKGDPVKPGVKTLLRRSAVKFTVSFKEEVRLAEMIPAILEYVGGVNHMRKVSDVIKPEFIEVNLVLPVKYSEEQEGGSIDSKHLGALNAIGASLSFEFL